MSLALMEGPQRLSLMTKDRIKRVVGKLIVAEVDYSWRGTRSPEDRRFLEKQKERANSAFEKLIKEL